MTLGKSREYLNDSKLVSRSQEKFYSFKSISKSQEILSQGLGGNMKRINGAVSDISPHHLPTNPRVYLESQDNCDFVILPGSSVLMSHSDLMSMTGIKNSGSLQLLPISESGRSTPASLCSNATVADIPYSGDNYRDHYSDHHNIQTVPGQKSHVEPLVEVAEEEIEEEDNKNQYSNERKGKLSGNGKGSSNNLLNTRRKSKQETAVPRAFNQKEEKNNINYETKQSMNRSGNINNKQPTAEVAVQVDLTKNDTTSVPSSNEAIRRKEKVEKIDSLKSSNSDLNCSPFMQLDGNLRQEKKLTRGFSHDDTLGEEHKRYSWREELEKFRSTKKPLAVSDLIDAFSSNSMQRKISSEDPSFPNIDSMKNKRRGSLQIQIDPKAFEKLTEAEENEKSQSNIKLQRRKSTSAILPLRLSEVKMANIDETCAELGGKADLEEVNAEFNNNSEPAVSEDDSVGGEADNEGTQSLPKGRVYLEKVNERKRTWDYFEINHPKAISDKKLQQLKAKYTRRKTEADILSNSKSNKDRNDNEKSSDLKTTVAGIHPIRTVSMPLFDGLVGSQQKAPLDLAFDPLTGECISADTESVDSGRESETVSRKLSTGSSEESTGSNSRKSSKSGRRKSSNLVDIIESDQLIPEEKVLECFIDPFTGQFITNEVSKQSQVKCQNNTQATTGTTASTGTSSNNKKKKKNLKVNVEVSQQDDDGIGSLPITPTDLVGKTKSLSLLKKPASLKCDGDTESIPTDDGICTSSEDRADCLCDAGSISSEDCQDVHSSSSVSRPDSNANVKSKQAADGANDTKLITMVNKVCLGSVSRGIEKFKSNKQCEDNAGQ